MKRNLTMQQIYTGNCILYAGQVGTTTTILPKEKPYPVNPIWTKLYS